MTQFVPLFFGLTLVHDKQTNARIIHKVATIFFRCFDFYRLHINQTNSQY